jgi:hypothetical protein
MTPAGQVKLSQQDEMVTSYAGLQPGVDAEPAHDRRRVRLDRVLASGQVHGGGPDIHPGGEASENCLLSRSQFAELPERAGKPRQKSFYSLLTAHGLIVHFSLLPVADSYTPQVEARRPM